MAALLPLPAPSSLARFTPTFAYSGVTFLSVHCVYAPATTVPYGIQAEESTCGGCSMEPSLPMGSAAAAPNAFSLFDDILNGDLNYLALNSQNIPIYVNTISYSNGNISVPSVYIENPTNVNVSIYQARFDVSGGSGCEYSTTPCMTSNSYSVAPTLGISAPGTYSVVGTVIPSQSGQTTSLTPSGYTNNPNNQFNTVFSASIRLMNADTGQAFLPISGSFP